MTSTGPGLTNQNVARFSRLRLRKETFVAFVADDDYIVASTDISATAAGDALTLAAAADGVLLPHGDRILVTPADASGTTLSVTLLIEGYRRGVAISESITVTGTTAGTTTKVFDEVSAITVTAISNNAASDTLKVGLSATRLGLWHGIEKASDVKRIIKRASAGTPSVVAVVEDTSVDVDEDAIIITGAAGDLYVVEYLATTKREGFAAQGALAST